MHHMHGNIPHLFVFWADLFVHIHLVKSSMLCPIQMAMPTFGRILLSGRPVIYYDVIYGQPL